ncbi:pentatricopeptide repeat-containing protein 2, mitochondrial-like [Sitodiplosis mosellana]|uniref:pentatricopeptide repeat-containing protein 2, mitochondrial-like n=1 Tax=Sitodiplosis mosellana TaxID=263140 RepID=UPI0024442A38|nr:pentatricopeptide repeat-containing protein 2, mitochondrial-like [Sitodiplosis mosellana]
MNFLKFSKRCVRLLKFQQLRQNARTLFTVETLDLTAYQNNRQEAFDNVTEPNKFKWELQAYVENESEMDALRLKAALEVLAHLAKPEDINLIKSTLYAFDSIESATDKAKRSIGNLVMKMVYSMNLPDVAIELYNDPKLSEFFGGFKSTLICLDCLYVNGKYGEILKIDSKKRQHLWSTRTNFTKFIDVLVFGASYKLNTAESFEYAKNLWSNVGQSTQFRRCVAFIAALALKQEKPSLAVQILKDSDFTNLTEQIKLLALADLGYANEINEALATWINDEKFSKKYISTDVLQRIQQRMKHNSTANTQVKFQEIYDELIANGRITNETLDEILDKPISPRVGIRGKRSIKPNINEILAEELRR